MKSKRNRCKLGMLAIALSIVSVLSGCTRSATRRELIQWFQENYTDAPLVVASAPLIDGNDILYEAYLESDPALTFYLKSDCSYVMEHSTYTNRTNFYAVYGNYYFSEYQKRYPVQFAEYQFDESANTFSLNIYYADRNELAEAFAELCRIQAYMDAQTYRVGALHHVYFKSPLCERDRFAFSLGSGAIDLTGAGDPEEIIRGKQKDLDSELAVWVSFFQLHTDWFTEEELAQAFRYRKSEAYDGDWKVYIGERTIYSGTEPVASDPQAAAPTAHAISFRQLYQILADVGWETLTGNADRFSFTGADGVVHEFSCEWQDPGNGKPPYGKWEWFADGVPYRGFGFSSEGYITSAYTFQELTGLQIKTTENMEV